MWCIEQSQILKKKKCTHKYFIECEMGLCFVREQRPSRCRWALSRAFQRRLHGGSSAAPTNILTKILFTIHSGLATVSLEVIIGGNQMLNPSAVQGREDYLQVPNLIVSPCMCVQGRTVTERWIDKTTVARAKVSKKRSFKLQWERIQCYVKLMKFKPNALIGSPETWGPFTAGKYG